MRFCGVPPPVRMGLIGRDRELADVTDLLLEKRRLVIHGDPGVGTTAFAVEAARRSNASGDSARAAYLSLASGCDPRWIVDSLGLLLCGTDFVTQPVERRMTLLFRAVSAEPTILVWDHCDRVERAPWPAGPETLNPVLEVGVELTQAARTRLLVVSRRGDLGYVPYQPSRRAGRYELTPLGAEAAGDLALRWTTGRHMGRRDTADLVVAADGNPLALRALAAVPGRPTGPAEPLSLAAGALLSAAGSRRDAVLSLSTLNDGGVESCCRAVSDLDEGDWDELQQTLTAAGWAEPEPLAGPGAERYWALRDSVTARLRDLARGSDPSTSAGAEERHRLAYLELAGRCAAGGGASRVALRERSNLLLALARSLEDDGDRAAALADALQELLDEPGGTSLIESVLSLAGALGGSVERIAS